MRPTAQNTYARAEEVLRFLAGAAVAVRLYPGSSPLRASALADFARVSAEAAAAGPLRYLVDPERFVFDGSPIAESFPQVEALCKALHALQAGQLIIAPGVTADETRAFLDVLGADPLAVRAAGGAREALARAGVSDIAIIEVSLRSAETPGIAGMDLTTAELADIAAELPRLAETWRDGTGGQAEDELGAAIDTLESAARDLASQRVAEALLRLDEASRVRVLSAAMTTDATGTPMRGMLKAVARLTPAALARLLLLAAGASGREPSALAGALELSPETAAALARLLATGAEAASGMAREAPAGPTPTELAAQVAETQEHDSARIEKLVGAARRDPAAARALLTAARIVALRPSTDSVLALGDALGAAADAAAWDAVAQAAETLRGLDTHPALEPEAARVRAALAETLVDRYAAADAAGRRALRPLLGRMAESTAPAAAKAMRADPTSAGVMVALLLSLHDKRLLPLVMRAIEQLDATARDAAIVAIADEGGADAEALLVRLVRSGDADLARDAAHELGRIGSEKATAALVETLQESGGRRRNPELTQATLGALERLRAVEALPAIEALARRRPVWGRHARETRACARRAAASIRQEQDR